MDKYADGGDWTNHILNSSCRTCKIAVEHICLGPGRLTYINRRSTNLVEGFTTTDLGTTDIVINGVQGPTVDNVVFKNSDIPKREYQALLLEGRRRSPPPGRSKATGRTSSRRTATTRGR